MKVFNLACDRGHVFEGWFASHEAFETQLHTRLVVCPFCDSVSITKQLSAPRLNISGAVDSTSGARPAAAQEQAISVPPAQMWDMMRAFIARTEDVGPRFAEEARKIHYGESPERGIRGQASFEERESLRDEGIESYALPMPSFLKEPTQ
jgi:hypothetical protein